MATAKIPLFSGPSALAIIIPAMVAHIKPEIWKKSV
jgi:hypothetical protein